MPANRSRILVADDDDSIRELVRTRLQLAGYEAYGARDGAEAVRRCLSLHPAAMILDLNMPGLDGFGVLESLRAHESSTKVLVLTARHAAGDVQRAVALGAKDYLAKPFTDAKLIARISRLLRGEEARPANYNPFDQMVVD